ncbi:MAG: DUF3050 domain-containing protein [Deltaproteobacteria bacterium]|nr:DUF3050 domain-containing protein [Deltaproteobacteria bacterium]
MRRLPIAADAPLPDPRDPLHEVREHLAARRTALLSHRLYALITDLESLQVFMRNHVFAVWDFMTLLKSLQRRLTGIEIPWIPPADTLGARLVNLIVLSEESDEVAPGRYVGHLHLYLAAMAEVDADSRPIRDVIAALRHKTSVEDAVERAPVLAATRRFVLHNIALARDDVHRTAAAFLFGREDPIPQMFQRIASMLEQQGVRCEAFHRYLSRHIHLDGEEHGVLGAQLLRGLCGNDARRWREATEAAAAALDERHRLWDSIAAEIDARRGSCADTII